MNKNRVTSTVSQITAVLAPAPQMRRARVDHDLADAITAGVDDHTAHRRRGVPDIHERGEGRLFTRQCLGQFEHRSRAWRQSGDVATKGKQHPRRRIFARGVGDAAVGHQVLHPPGKRDRPDAGWRHVDVAAPHAGRTLRHGGDRAPPVLGAPAVAGQLFAWQDHVVPLAQAGGCGRWCARGASGQRQACSNQERAKVHRGRHRSLNGKGRPKAAFVRREGPCRGPTRAIRTCG